MIFIFKQIDIARQTILFELENLLARPEQDEILTDMIHAVSFYDFHSQKNLANNLVF